MVNSKNKISTYISSKLKEQGNIEFAQSRSHLIKERVTSFGVRVGKIRKIVRDLLKEIPELQNKKRCLKIATELMTTKIFENQLVSIFFLKVLVEKEELKDIHFLKILIVRYVDNWAVCDTISTEIVAKIIIQHPEEIQSLLKWTKSRSIWLKRAVIVSAIKAKSKIKNWNAVSDKIIFDLKNEKEDILKKGIKWLKREKTSFLRKTPSA